jgi:chromatin remodeling complex protein RSC6
MPPKGSKTSAKTTVPKTSTKTAAKTTKQSVTAAPAVVNEVEKEENAVVEASPNDAIFESMTSFAANLQSLYTQMNAIKAQYRALEKKMQRELKQASKITAKKAKRKGSRAPSGFVKPTKISDELATFLSKPHGSEMARTDVTREINAYIRANNLQDKDNGRKINPDSKLSKLLKLGKSDELTYFNLQRYMSHHFAKANKPLVNA